jgi:hypothetical protein
MLADVAKRQIADVHAVDHQRAGNAKNASRVVRAQFLIFGQDSDPFALGEMAENGFDQ